MNDALVFPNTQRCLMKMIDGAVHVGQPVEAYEREPANEQGYLTGIFPIAVVYAMPGGSEGFIDRLDRITVDVFSDGERAVDVLESIKSSICGDSIDTPSGYLDSIRPGQVPTAMPYQSDTIEKATATFLVTSRPI